MIRPASLPDFADVRAARERLKGHVLETPVFGRRSLNTQVGCEIYFKCENLQRTGSFKYRGASNAVMLLEQNAERGVATHSSGNHGAALALAARERGVPAYIVVPDNAPATKRQAIEIYGGRLIESGPTLAEREATLAGVLEETGAHFVPPYNHGSVIAGQATAALELHDAQPDLEEVWVPVGGGGLASGTVLAMQERGVRVVGAEPALADDAYWSLRKGEIQPPKPPLTVADGLRTALGTLTFTILSRYGLNIVRVGEDEILAAQRLIWSRLKLVVEASSAVPFAALLQTVAAAPEVYRGRRVGILLSGGNVQFPAG